MVLDERQKPPERMGATLAILRRAVPLNGFVLLALHRPARAQGRNPLVVVAARPRCDYAGASTIRLRGCPGDGKNEAVLPGKFSPRTDYTPPDLIRKGALRRRHAVLCAWRRCRSIRRRPEYPSVRGQGSAHEH